ncbi:type IV pilus biogenesis protein PilM [Bacillus sp. DJP31]|uniref:type IV pilus biogenesis protein PilM n=1 Tax=Bacillus sp. DJP31 TaxID=3409789 RepID=UPI003BB658D0
MVFSLLSGVNKPVNIIIKDHVIRYVELKQVSPLVIHKNGERYLPHGLIKEGRIIDRTTLVMILEECIQEWGLKNRKVRFIVPDSFVVIRKVEVPIDIMDDEIKGFLQFELGTSIHLPFENSAIDFSVIGQTTDKKSVLLFASPEAIISEYTELLQEVKLKPVEADISPLSLYRLYFNLDLVKQDERLLFIQFDHQSVNLSIFEDYKPIFMRQVLIDSPSKLWSREDGSFMYQGEMEELMLQFNDIYKEIERVMTFYRFSLNQGKQQLTKLVVTGDHPMITKVFKEIEDRFDIPVKPLSIHELPLTTRMNLTNGFELAIGLALKEV